MDRFISGNDKIYHSLVHIPKFTNFCPQAMYVNCMAIDPTIFLYRSVHICIILHDWVKRCIYYDVSVSQIKDNTTEDR